MPSRVLTTDQAAEYLTLTKQTLRNMRRLGIGPKYLEMFVGKESGFPSIGYRVEDLEEWLEAQAVEPAEVIKRRWA